jgi:hypothetical protein
LSQGSRVRLKQIGELLKSQIVGLHERVQTISHASAQAREAKVFPTHGHRFLPVFFNAALRTLSINDNVIADSGHAHSIYCLESRRHTLAITKLLCTEELDLYECRKETIDAGQSFLKNGNENT